MGVTSIIFFVGVGRRLYGVEHTFVMAKEWLLKSNLLAMNPKRYDVLFSSKREI